MKKNNLFNSTTQSLKLCAFLLVSFFILGTNTSKAQCPGLKVSPDVTICAGNTTVLSASGALLYNWSPANGLLGNGRVVNARPTTTTTYTMTGTTALGCTARLTVKVTVKPRPVITVTGNTTICSGGSTTLTASGASTYTWGPATGLSATSGATVTANPKVTTTYTVTGMNDGGCDRSQLVTIYVEQTPELVITGIKSICEGTATILTAAGAASYTWGPATGLSTTSGAIVGANPARTTTYTVTGTTLAGCTSKQTVTIVVTTPPSITISGNRTICAGGTTELTASGATTYLWGPATALNTTAGATIIAAPLQTTTFTVIGTNTAGCSSTQTVTVKVNPLPIITVTGERTICAGNATALTASGASTYTWGPATGLSATTGATVKASPAITTTYTVTGTTDGGCTTTRPVTVFVNTPITAITGIKTICEGGSTTLTAAGDGTYTWGPATGLNVTTGNVVVASPRGTTTYTVTAKNLAGCTATQTVTVTVVPRPTVTTSGNQTICAGDRTQLTASGAANFVWNTATSTVNNGAALVTDALQATTTFTVVGNATLPGCATTQTVQVTVIPAPIITVSGTRTICQGGKTTLTASGAATYTWAAAAGLSATTGAVVVASPTVTTTYTVTGKNAAGCTGRTLVTVLVNELPQISIGGPTSICQGAVAQLTASGAANFVWQTVGGATTQGATLINDVIKTATTFTVTGTNAAGCVSTRTVTVTPVAPPAITVNIPATICAGATAQITASGAANFIWQTASGATTQGATLLNEAVKQATTFTVIATNAIGCRTVQTVTVTPAPLPVINVNIPSTICAGNLAQLTASGATNFIWQTVGGATTQGATLVNDAIKTATTFTVTGAGANGCRAVQTVTVTPMPLPVINVNVPTVCAGETAQLTASGATQFIWQTVGAATTQGATIINNAVQQATTYTVTGVGENGCRAVQTVTVTPVPLPKITVGGNTICAGDVANLTASGAAKFIWETAGAATTQGATLVNDAIKQTTTFTLTGVNDLGCKAIQTVTVTVNQLPQVVVSGANNTVCEGSNVQLSASGAAKFIWETAGAATTQGASIITNVLGNTTFTVTGINELGCRATNTVTVNVLPSPKVSVSGNRTICEGGSTQLNAAGANTYVWSNASGLNTTQGPSVTANPRSTTTYTVVGTSLNGCVSSATVTVKVNPSPIIKVSGPVTICNGNNVLTPTTTTLTASGAVNYTWSLGTGLNGTTGASVVASPASTTTYTVVGTDALGCQGTNTVKVTVDCSAPKSLNETSTADAVVANKDGQIFPNPTAGIVSIYPLTGNDKTSISIIDALGRTVYETKANDNATPVQIDLSNQAEGLYFVKLVNGSTTVFAKIIKQ